MNGKKILAGIALTCFSLTFSSAALAEEDFVTLGYHPETEKPLMLNLKGTRGGSFEIVTPYGDGLKAYTYRASCGETRLFSTGTRLYSSTGKKLDESRSREEIKYNPKTIPGAAMKLVCQKIGARGW